MSALRRMKGEGRRTRKKKVSCLVFFFLLSFCALAKAEVSIETSVSRSILPVGEQLVLDIIVSNADGRIEQPKISSVDGFTSYSQGHSQEFSIINGKSSSRSVYSYVLVANTVGQKIIGPFAVVIGGKEYKIAPVKVQITQGNSASGQYAWSQSPVTSPPSRAMPSSNVGDQDIFVKAWLDKDEVYVNEPVMLTYTLFTRLSATYKGFEKEPVTTGFWVEDFPPEKTIRRTEQFLNGQRYVVADVRKLALFPTEAGVFTLDPGVLSAVVEVRSDDGFQTFFSSNIFGSRRGFSTPFTTEVVSKILSAQPVKIISKALPETNKPKNFTGAVGQFQIESFIDKTDVEVGDPLTLRLRIYGKGNINTVQSSKLPKMDDFKVYDSSSSTNISKERLVVEGERVTETVIVPKKQGTYEIPPAEFSFFDPVDEAYKTIKSQSHTLRISGGTAPPESLTVSSSESVLGPDSGVEPVDKEEVGFVAKDIRFIKTSNTGEVIAVRDFFQNPVYWTVNIFLILVLAGSAFFSTRLSLDLKNRKGSRLRRSHSIARSKLKNASKYLNESKSDEFYEEMSKAVHGYFADKFNISPQGLSQEKLEELIEPLVSSELLNKINRLFDGASMGRFAKIDKAREDMKDLFELADEVITAFEKVKIK